MESIFNAKKDDEISPVNYIKEKFKEDFDIELEENLDDNENMMNDGQKQEYKKFQEKIQDIITLSSNDYFYFKKYFKQNVKHNDSKEIELKIKNKIYISFEKIINNFIDFEDFKD
jgi:hypothetical protein